MKVVNWDGVMNYWRKREKKEKEKLAYSCHEISFPISLADFYKLSCIHGKSKSFYILHR